jgi:hypothetical protein
MYTTLNVLNLLASIVRCIVHKFTTFMCWLTSGTCTVWHLLHLGWWISSSVLQNILELWRGDQLNV